MTFTTLLFIIAFSILTILSIALIHLYGLYYKQREHMRLAYKNIHWLDDKIRILKDKIGGNILPPTKRYPRQGVRK